MKESGGELNRIISWNVNGIRAAHRNGFRAWFDAERARGAMVIGLQEVRARAEEVPEELAPPPGWALAVTSAEKKGYSGVGLYAGAAPDAVATTLGVQELDSEGRFIEARFGELTVVNAYFPNGNGSTDAAGKRTNDRIPYKLDFYRAIFERLKPRLERGEKLIVMGDFNTAHRPIDLARPKTNRQTSGFTDIERAEIDVWLAAGWVDSFRHFYPDREDVYSWWSQRFGIRQRNVGWRIDMVMVSPAVLPHLRDAFIDTEVLGSDHCPVGISVDFASLTGEAP